MWTAQLRANELPKTPIGVKLHPPNANSRPVDTPNAFNVPNDCKELMHHYQNQCGGKGSEKKNLIYFAAKSAVNLVFDDEVAKGLILYNELVFDNEEEEEKRESTALKNGRAFLRKHENTNGLIRSPLADDKNVRNGLLSFILTMHERRQNILKFLAYFNYEHWKECYRARFMYHKACELNGTESGHQAAYDFFKIAYLIGRVLIPQITKEEISSFNELNNKLPENRRSHSPSCIIDHVRLC